MRFMTLVKATRQSEAGAPPNPALMEAIDKLTQEGIKDGTFVSAGGLLPSSRGARVKASKGAVSVTNGPFTELREIIGGWAILEYPSLEEAIEAARKFMQLHIDVMGPDYEGECEVRQLYGPEGCA